MERKEHVDAFDMEFWVDVENGSWLVDILNVNSCHFFSNLIFRKHCDFIAFLSHQGSDSTWQATGRHSDDPKMSRK